MDKAEPPKTPVPPEFEKLHDLYKNEVNLYLACPTHGPVLKVVNGKLYPVPIAQIKPKFANNQKAVNFVTVDVVFMCPHCYKMSVPNPLIPLADMYSFAEVELCPDCKGKGRLPIPQVFQDGDRDEKCERCDGYGMMKKDVEIEEQVVADDGKTGGSRRNGRPPASDSHEGAGLIQLA